MHSRVLLAFGVGVAVGSVCRPRSTSISQSLSVSTVESSTIVLIITEEPSFTSSTIETFAESATTETLVVAQTTSSEEIATTETTAEPAPVTTSTEFFYTTTPALMETTTSSTPSIPTLFNLVASSGPAKDTYLRGTSITALFNAELGLNLELSIESSTNRLRWSDLYICASYNYRLKTATLTPCAVSTDDSPYVTCQAPVGDTIQCSVPDCRMYQFHSEVPPFNIIEAMQCREDKAPWTQFYTRIHGETKWYAELGARDVTDASFTAVDVKVLPR